MKDNNLSSSKFLEIYGYLDLICVLIFLGPAYFGNYGIKLLLPFLSMLGSLCLRLNLMDEYEGKFSILSKLPTYALIKGSILLIIFVIGFKFTRIGYLVLFYSLTNFILTLYLIHDRKEIVIRK